MTVNGPQPSLKCQPIGRACCREMRAQPRQQSIQRKLGLTFQPGEGKGIAIGRQLHFCIHAVARFFGANRASANHAANVGGSGQL